MNPMGYNDFAGHALFQSVQQYKDPEFVPEPGPQPDGEYSALKNKTVRRVGLWQRSTGWVAGLFRTRKPEIADQC